MPNRMRHANSLTDLEFEVIKALRVKTSVEDIVKISGASLERVNRAIGYLNYRAKIAKEKSNG